MEYESVKPKAGGAISLSRGVNREPSEEVVERLAVDETLGWGVDASQGMARLQKRAAHLQHAMNNPLAALLAEEQLFTMHEALTAEQRETVERMIELTRRVIALVREMDGLRGIQRPR
jgi:hypothetical protein